MTTTDRFSVHAWGGETGEECISCGVTWDDCDNFCDAELRAAIARHPAGRGLDPDKPFPSRFSERYDPSPEPIDRKIR